MSGINKAIIIGNLGGEPEVRYMPNGKPVANFSVATSERWKDKDTGEHKEETEWHRIVIFGRLAEIAGEYLHKGSKVYLEGKLRTRSWTNKEGVEQRTTEIVANQMQMLGGEANNQRKAESATPPPAPQAGGNAPQQQQSDFDDFDDDIPF